MYVMSFWNFICATKNFWWKWAINIDRGSIAPTLSKSESTYCKAIYIRCSIELNRTQMMRPAHQKSGDLCLTIDFIAAKTRALWTIKLIYDIVKFSAFSPSEHFPSWPRVTSSSIWLYWGICNWYESKTLRNYCDLCKQAFCELS